MGSVGNRPLAGTWKLNNRQVVKYTPDALVFLNGDTSLPGCPRCRGRIRIQDYVTSLSVEAGTGPTSHSASINLTLPRVQGQQLFIDGYNVLRVGLEVNIFMRGYFQVRGMFRHLKDPQNLDSEGTPGQLGSDFSFQNPTDNDKLDLSKYATYPYYPVFHGVVTQVSYDYADGFYTGTLQCASLLHFWQFQNIATASAWMAQDKKPNNDPARPTLQGHNFNNMHPFGIIYTLYRDVAGAASGVEYALSEESNMDPANQSGSAQIYDQMTLYWTQRFKTRIQNLRMYGVNGQLFNSAQQAWLGTASNRDVDGLLPSPTYNDPSTTRTEKDPTSARWSAAKALGLASAGSDFVYSPLINSEGETLSLSVLDMFAFSQSMAEFGPGNVWQSTYQTKLDMAQNVMEVTGYEFYQDVDGDIVFKPPFYNLDTATSRYYRLEDQDIINISFTEKEPTATFIIVRGSWFQGFTDLVPNANGPTTNRGLYIDYKLVAQFGWRPAATLDITYATDPKILFWIGVARLDMLNVDTFSASCTIPIRPEMRPGYPVFIPFVDCYYYISQLSHSFAFAGTCTTSLVLTCRRAKFHAPGELKAMAGITGVGPGTPIESAVKLIKLDRPDLPPRPLQAYDQSFTTGQGVVEGVPRIIGFPNVVLALDPEKINPNFTVIGLGVEFFDQTKGDANILFSMLQRDVDLSDAFEAVGFSVGPDGKQSIADPKKITRFKLRYSSNPDQFAEFDLLKLQGAYNDFQNYRSQILSLESQITEQQKAVEQALGFENAYSSLDKQGTRGLQRSQELSSERAKLNTLRGQLRSEQAQLERARSGSGAPEGVNLVAMVFEALQPTQNKPIRRRVDGIAGSDVTMSYFETLSHLKTQYVANTIPGSYRYYSSAHPEEKMQGQPIVIFNDGELPPSGGRIPRSRRRSDGRIERESSTRQNFVPQTRAEVRALTQRMQDALDRNGVTTMQAVEPTPVPSQFVQNRKNSNALLGAGLGGNNRRADENLDSISAQRLVDIAVVVDGVIKACLGRADWPSTRTLIVISTWRPDEGPETEAIHGEGQAMDIQVSGSQGGANKKTNAPDDVRKAFEVLQEESVRVMSDGLITGLGTYIGRPSGWFVHLDRRDVESLQNTRQRKADAAGVPVECYPPEVPPTKEKPKGKKKGAWSHYPGKDRWQQGRTDKEAEASLKESAAALGVSWPPKGTRFPEPVPGNTDIFPEGIPTPEEPPPETNEPAPEVEPAPPAPDPEPTAPAELITRDLSLDAPRKVVQFKPTVTAPAVGRVPPEVELTLGNCIKGLNIAQGPQRTPKLLTTDQIQTISFIRYESSKNTQVVGTSTSAGSKSFREIGFFEDLSKKFAEAGQAIVGSNITVADGYQSKYDQIKQDVEQIEIPVYDENGQPVEPRGRVELLPFEEAVRINSELLAPDVQDQIGTSGEISLAGLTFDQLSTAQGYASGGQRTDASENTQDTIQRVANRYSKSVQGQITAAFNQAKADALLPADGKEQRLAEISDAFNQISGAATGDANGGAQVEDNESEDKAPKQGKSQKPLHAPVFPVSDEKGYIHYGAYRYGRGLSVEPGGTFEFIHSGQDPFRNVTSQTSDEFVQELVLAGQGKVSPLSNELAGIRDAAMRSAQERIEGGDVFGALGDVATGIGDAASSAGSAVQQGAADAQAAQKLAASVATRDGEVADLEDSLINLAITVSSLKQTARGRDILRELLEANGDDPQLVESTSFQITDTQFARNFANYAVNYAKSPVFKTTVANAAYQLSDLTSHLVTRAGDTCVCRGSYSDVVLEAYSRINFISVDGIDQETDKPTAYHSEEILRGTAGKDYANKQLEGTILEGEQPDAKAFRDAQSGGMQGTDLGAPLSQSSDVPSQVSPGVVGPDNPSTTADAAGAPQTDGPNPNDFGFSDSASAEEALAEAGVPNSAAELDAVGQVLQASPGELQQILDTYGPEGIREFVADREAQEGFGQGDAPSGTSNIDRGLGVSADEVLALLYLQSRGISEED